MKKPLLLLLSMVLLATFGCDTFEQEDGRYDQEYDTTLSDADLNFNCSGGDASFSIKSDGPWRISNTNDWCTVDVTSGSGDAEITVTVTKYSDEDQTASYINRQRELMVWTDNGTPQKVLINQYAKTTFIIEEAGSLKSLITAANASKISSLTLIGKINYKDLQTIRSLTALSSVDLKDTNIEAVTVSGTTYPAETIPAQAFASWNSLLSFALPQNLLTIGAEAFSQCSALTLLNIPTTVTSIEKGAYVGCSKLGQLAIPNAVTSIGDQAFKDCSGIKSLVLGTALTTLGDEAFSKTGISTIVIPSGVTSVGKKCFAQCADIASVSLPSSLTTIGNEAFAGCTKLTTLNIPSSITTLGSNAFPAVSDMVVSLEDLTFIDLFKSAPNLTLSLIGDISEIPDHTFENYTELSAVLFPASIQTVGESAFAGCAKLGAVEFYAKLTTIKANAFANCKALASIKLTEGVKTIEEKAFSGIEACSINLPISLTSVAADAFENTAAITATLNNTTFVSRLAACPDLKVEFTDNKITSLSAGAFKDITGLKTVTLGEGIETIEAEAFSGCTGLTSILFPEEGFTTIKEKAFAGISAPLTMTLPNSITAIADNAFAGTDNLSLTMSKLAFANAFSSIASLDLILTDGVKEITASYFKDWAGLKSIVLPESAEYIRQEAFSGCTLLKTISLPASLREIGEKAFAGCTGGLTFTIPSGLRTFATSALNGATGVHATLSRLSHLSAFSNCTDFSLTITGIATLPEEAFKNAIGLKAITLPATLTAISNKAFSTCTALTSVTCEGETPATLGTNAFASVSGAVLKVPSAKVNDYKASTWKNYFTTIQAK